MGRDVLHPAGAELVHDHGALLGPHGDPPRGGAVRHLESRAVRAQATLHRTLLGSKVSMKTEHFILAMTPHLVEGLYGGEDLVKWPLLQVVVVHTVQDYVHLASGEVRDEAKG